MSTRLYNTTSNIYTALIHHHGSLQNVIFSTITYYKFGILRIKVPYDFYNSLFFVQFELLFGSVVLHHRSETVYELPLMNSHSSCTGTTITKVIKKYLTTTPLTYIKLSLFWYSYIFSLDICISFYSRRIILLNLQVVSLKTKVKSNALLSLSQ